MTTEKKADHTTAIAVTVVGLGALGLLAYLLLSMDPGRKFDEFTDWTASGLEWMAKGAADQMDDARKGAAAAVDEAGKWLVAPIVFQKERAEEALVWAEAEAARQQKAARTAAEALWKAPGEFAHEVQQIRLPEVKIPAVRLPKWKPPWEGAKSTLWGMEVNGIITLP